MSAPFVTSVRRSSLLISMFYRSLFAVPPPTPVYAGKLPYSLLAASSPATFAAASRVFRSGLLGSKTALARCGISAASLPAFGRPDFCPPVSSSGLILTSPRLSDVVRQ